MTKAKRGGGRGVGARPSVSSARRGGSKEGSSAASEGAYLSDSSEDFLPLDGQGRDENSSEDESGMLRQMGLEGAEHAASEEDEESDDDGQSDSQASAADEEEGDDASSGNTSCSSTLVPSPMGKN